MTRKEVEVAPGFAGEKIIAAKMPELDIFEAKLARLNLRLEINDQSGSNFDIIDLGIACPDEADEALVEELVALFLGMRRRYKKFKLPQSKTMEELVSSIIYIASLIPLVD